MIGLPTGSENWCSVGAMTRVAKYAQWINASVEYLEGFSLSRVDHGKDGEDRGRGSDEDDGRNPCDSNPCGPNAVCWNSGDNFMCTCDADWPHGNPYFRYTY